MDELNRRSVLKMAVGAALLGAGVLRELLMPGVASAAWPKGAFDAKTSKDAITHLYQDASVERTNAVRILAPDLAENGSIVPITVSTDLRDVESIVILAEENPRALTSTYTLGKRAVTPISVRVKLAKTQNVTAIVKAQGRLYSATKPITVSIGGCGG